MHISESFAYPTVVAPKKPLELSSKKEECCHDEQGFLLGGVNDMKSQKHQVNRHQIQEQGGHNFKAT